MPNACEHCCTRIENLGVKAGAVSILEGIDIHLNCREIVAVIGPNGAGKTTLLRAILGEIPSTGKISFRFRGQPVKYPRIGYVPQKLNFDLDSPVSVIDFMASAIGKHPVWFGIKPKLRRRVKEGLEKVSAAHLWQKRIGELSGGELQRVLLAMAMIPPPDLLLLDEPVSGVDAGGLSLFYQMVNNMRLWHDMSVIMVTHDLGGVAPHADRIILLNRTILTQGKPEDVLRDEKMVKTFGATLRA